MAKGRVAFTSRYLLEPVLTVGQAAAVLRAVFVLAFMAQTLVAVLVGVVIRGLAGEVHPGGGVLGWVLVAFVAVQLPVVLLVVARSSSSQAQPGARRRALYTAILAGVMLSSTVWFLTLAVVAAQPLLPLVALLLQATLAYGLGFLQMGRLARGAAAERLGAGAEEAPEVASSEVLPSDPAAGEGPVV